MKKVLITLVLTLILVGTNVWGQESWVLWVHKSTLQKSQINAKWEWGKDDWEIERAFPNYNQCMELRSEICEARRDGIKRIIKDSVADCFKSGLMWGEPDKYVVTEKYECFPSTLDPRSPRER